VVAVLFTGRKAQEETMEDYKDYLPRRKDVQVGDKKLTVQEYNLAKRDAVVKVLLSNLDVVPMVQPFFSALRELKNHQRELVKKALTGGKDAKKLKELLAAEANKPDIDLGAVAGQVKVVALKLLSSDLSLIACLTLDTPENRKIVGMESPKVVEHPKHRFFHCPEMFTWVRENVLPRNEPDLVGAIVETNDFAGLVKNWFALVVSQVKATGEESKKEKATA